jgi:hypothetical protein
MPREIGVLRLRTDCRRMLRARGDSFSVGRRAGQEGDAGRIRGKVDWSDWVQGMNCFRVYASLNVYRVLVTAIMFRAWAWTASDND